MWHGLHLMHRDAQGMHVDDVQACTYQVVADIDQSLTYNVQIAIQVKDPRPCCILVISLIFSLPLLLYNIGYTQGADWFTRHGLL